MLHPEMDMQFKKKYDILFQIAISLYTTFVGYYYSYSTGHLKVKDHRVPSDKRYL